VTGPLEVDVAIVGGGIAGASLAAHLSAERSVALLEREDQPGYHASGRSAALFSETYGNAVVRALSVGSRSFLVTPPEGFSDHPLLTPRGALHVGGPTHDAHLARMLEEVGRLAPSTRRVSRDEALALVPVLRPDRIASGVYEPDAMDIDTNALLAGFLRVAKGRGARVVTGAQVAAAAFDGTRWRIETGAGEVRAAILVDAAGAWADELAGLAGAEPLGLTPLRRTAFVFEPPPGVAVERWPIVIGADEDVYFKPDAGLILGSPADETPSPPTDAQAEELDVAIAVERIQEIADLPVRRIVRRWAGLRTFAPDKTPVAGFDPDLPGFFWLAGQGGYGFQTAPALSWSAASLILRGALPPGIEDLGVTAEALAPGRLRG
jgi:D-arginine dehydrogenase